MRSQIEPADANDRQFAPRKRSARAVPIDAAQAAGGGCLGVLGTD
jgi:hypothetical protein